MQSAKRNFPMATEYPAMLNNSRPEHSNLGPAVGGVIQGLTHYFQMMLRTLSFLSISQCYTYSTSKCPAANTASDLLDVQYRECEKEFSPGKGRKDSA